MEEQELPYVDLARRCYEVAEARGLWNMTHLQTALKLLSELGELAEEIRIGRRGEFEYPSGKPVGIDFELADLWMILQGYLIKNDYRVLDYYPLLLGKPPVAQEFTTLVNVITRILNQANNNNGAQLLSEPVKIAIGLVEGVAVKLEVDLKRALNEKFRYNQACLATEQGRTC